MRDEDSFAIIRTMSNQTSKTRGYVITGTDTGIGKTVVAAMLTQVLSAYYYKPVQAGLDEPTDTDRVRQLTDLPNTHFKPEIYRLKTPASPHLAASIDGLEIDSSHLQLPDLNATLIVEGAGGVMVPLNSNTLYIDVFRNWQLPVIVCTRTTLGTINHTLLTLEALTNRDVKVHGLVFVGEAHEENERIIPKLGKVKHLGRLPMLDPLNADSLSFAFEQYFDINDYQC